MQKQFTTPKLHVKKFSAANTAPAEVIPAGKCTKFSVVMLMADTLLLSPAGRVLQGSLVWVELHTKKQLTLYPTTVLF